jgi:hypothetical protein
MKDKSGSRGFIQIVVILIALVLVAAGAYYFGTIKNKVAPAPIASVQSSSSPVASADPMVNWKTYNNPGMYEHMYPPTWRAAGPNTVYNGPSGSNVSDPNSKYPDGTFTVDYYNLSYCSTEPKYVREYNWTDLHETTEIISGETGIVLSGKLDFNDNINHDRKLIFLTNGNNCYVIGTWSYQNPDQEKTFDQILSTFKFTK